MNNNERLLCEIIHIKTHVITLNGSNTCRCTIIGELVQAKGKITHKLVMWKFIKQRG